MAFQYETDTAADVPDFFANLEALLVAAGWVHVSGTGTTTIVYSSTGEVGTLTQLYIRIWQDGPNPERVFFRVQDDGGGTHFTTSTSIGYLVAPGAGDVPFKYWITATKDMVIITFSAEGYSTCYVGITDPFAVNPPDETYQMVSVGLHSVTVYPDWRPYVRVLHRYDDTWDYQCNVDECTHEYNPNDLDGSHALFGGYVYNISDHRENYGQLRYCSGRIVEGTGINAEDTITSGYPGATSEWTVFGAGYIRWAVASAAPLPTGTPDGPNCGYVRGVAASIGELEAALEDFLTARGWVIADWPTPVYPIDRSFSSVGESGGETIVLRWIWDAAQRYWGAQVYDAIGGTHYTSRITPGNDRIDAGDWPLYYWFSGDKDCFVVIVYLSSAYEWAWFGLCKSFFPDPTLIDSSYMVGAMNDAQRYCLRNPNGSWVGSIDELVDPGWLNSSPNRIDGKTFVIFPYPLSATGAASKVPWGTTQYLFRMSSLSLSLGDYVQAGGHIVMCVGYNWALKVA